MESKERECVSVIHKCITNSYIRNQDSSLMKDRPVIIFSMKRKINLTE